MTAPEWRVLHEDEHVVVSFRDAEADLLLALFDPAWRTGADGPVWGAKLADKFGCAALAVRCKALNWFPPASMAAAVAAARPALDRFARIMTYGLSYGAYGALKHARRLQAGLTVAFSPQNPTIYLSQDGRLDPATQAALAGYDVTPADLARRSFIFFDPLVRRDKETIQTLRRAGAAGCTMFRTYGTGHISLLPFTRSGVIERAVAACLADRPAALPSLWAEARRNNPLRPVGVAGDATRRHPALAVALWQQHRALFSPEQAVDLLTRAARRMARTGQRPAARAALQEAAAIARDRADLVRMVRDAQAVLPPEPPAPAAAPDGGADLARLRATLRKMLYAPAP